MQSKKELKTELIKILKWFHEFCLENNLKYYAVGGTALGAVRHKGFIPWDDDIDVGMPREDYERFKAITKDKFFGNYIVESTDSPAKEFLYLYSKIYDTSTTLIESTRKPIKRGIYIDVFPLDGVGESYQESVEYVKKILKAQRWLFANTCALRKGRSLHKNLAIIMARLIPPFILDNKKMVKKIEYSCQQKGFAESKYVANIVGNWGIKEIVLKEFFGQPQPHDFEDIRIYIPEKYDEYLKALYGDYMKLPPIEKQKTHHQFIECNLEEPYLR